MKRSPEAAYRLRARRTATTANTNQWNGNIQGATNDSNDYKPSVRIVDGFPVEYSCRDDPRDNNIVESDLRPMELTFDYDMLTRQDADIEGSIRSLEWSLLWNAARNLGLHNCNFRKQRPALEEEDDDAIGTSTSTIDSNNVRRQLFSQDYVVDLSSLEFDFIDPTADSCTLLEDDPTQGVPTACTPVVGRMTAHYTGDEDTIRAYLMENIEMEMNSNRVRIEDVEDCRFVGDRDALEASRIRVEIDSGNSSTNMAVVLSVVVGVIAVGLALLVVRGRRRQQQLVLDGEDDDLPTTIATVAYQKPVRPSSGNSNSESHSSLQSASSGDTEESLPDRIDNLEDPNTPIRVQGGAADKETGAQLVDEEQTSRDENIMMDVSSDNTDSLTEKIAQDEKQEELPLLVAQPPKEAKLVQDETSTETVPIRASPPEEQLEDKENQKVASTGVPPRPPIFVIPLGGGEKKDKEPATITKAASKTLQPRRRRKKKKKKKVRVLKRVSSRNSIDEMETIQEQGGDVSDGDDTGSEFGSEYGSEYSTDDEQDLDPSVLMNMHTNGDGGGVENTDRFVPSPIKEEPKIRRLPPPWI